MPIGLRARVQRKEFDSLGNVVVLANRYRGAQGQRNLIHFDPGNDRMPHEVYHAYGYVKKADAIMKTRHGRLLARKGQAIKKVSDEAITRQLDEDFPLYVSQTGSSPQSKMNGNEVVPNRCIQHAGGALGSLGGCASRCGARGREVGATVRTESGTPPAVAPAGWNSVGRLRTPDGRTRSDRLAPEVYRS